MKSELLMDIINYQLPHRRFNPLTADWVLVSPHRSRRPWLGQVEKVTEEARPKHDPDCYLCPGNSRVGGVQNPVYTSTYVFDNDFQALLTPEAAARAGDEPGTAVPQSNNPLHSSLFHAQQELGLSRVVCFHPRHDLTLPLMSQEEVAAVITTWTDQTRELGNLDFIRYVQVFENKGAQMGASNPHPHSQIWATSRLPNEPLKELNQQITYQGQHAACLLCDYLEAEARSGERVVERNAYFSGLVPFWAIWPFEVLLVSHRHVASLTDLNSDEVLGLADIIRSLTSRYDNLFEVSFPYSMGFHQAPTDGQAYPACHLHAHYYPPLLRSATVRKFMVGYEMLAMPQRDLTPEGAAARLRQVGNVHYRLR